jgi:acylaminoacyl-peptidase
MGPEFVKQSPGSLALTILMFAGLMFAGASAGVADDSEKTIPVRPDLFQPADVFQLEYAADPQLSPDGSLVVYARRSHDIMKDRTRSELWTVATQPDDRGRFDHRPLGASGEDPSSPTFSDDGTELFYVATDSDSGAQQIHRFWFDTGLTAVLTRIQASLSGIAPSPDGQWIAFQQFVASSPTSSPRMPERPEGADWAPAPRTVDTLVYRADGAGFLEQGYRHIFVVPTSGGTPRQLTQGDFNHGSPSWTPDSKHLIFSANRREDAEYESSDTEIYELQLADGALRALTSRYGPDGEPAVSPDGRRVAYTGYDEEFLGYQISQLYVLDRESGASRQVASGFDRSLSDPVWQSDSRHVVVQYSSEGNGKIARFDTQSGEVETLASDAGGLSLGRPYGGAAFSLARSGGIAFTLGTPSHPADVAYLVAGRDPVRLTDLNDDLFSHKQLAPVEEIWVESSHDGQKIQGWVAKPPGFDPSQKYPLLLEIHGGPFADYGDRFAAEIQLYAAAGYVVLYTNPRGSSSYGKAFGNLIHHDYPNHDYDDLMSSVDAVIARGYIDPDRLFVTGGSGGGVLTSWIVGHTDRFAAAAVQKPVINWYSWALTADIATTYKYWFPGPPWEHQDHYMKRSPIAYVGNVETPTLVITGEVDYRTPMSESEQYYQALKIRKVPAALVRIPEASHGIAARPSHLIAKVVHILDWFEKHASK